ncbi:MAG: glycosyltransferase [Planctomycetota bacterium]
MTPRVTLAITTHARADALARVLACVRAQSRPPDELIVAEDGADAATAAVVAHHASVASAAQTAPRLRHLQQPHQGFRVARLRNLAIAAATGDYIVFVDGDMLLHPRFVEDHARCARRGYWTQGVRVPLGADASTLPGPLSRGRFGLRRAALWYAPRLQRALRSPGAGLLAVKSCNQGFWQDDLLRVNGFDERFEGWGPEDKELCARLGHAGVRRQALLGGGIACHLHHPPAPRDRRAFNESLLAATLAARTTRCERGVDGHRCAPHSSTTDP